MSDTSPQELLALFDRELRIGLEEHGQGREVLAHVIRHVPRSPDARWGWIIYSDVDETNADAVIAEQVNFYESRGLSFEWKWYSHDKLPDLPDRLLKHGFEAEDLESVMVLDLEQAPASLWRSREEGIRRITERPGLLDIVAIENAVWPEPHDWIADELAEELADQCG